MADEPNNMVLVLLREIHAVQEDHSRVLAEHSRQFGRLEKRLDEVHESMVTSLGLAAHANVRHQTVGEEIEDLKRRVARIESELHPEAPR